MENKITKRGLLAMQKRANRYLNGKTFNECELYSPVGSNLKSIYECAFKISNHMSIHKSFSISFSDRMGNVPARVVYDRMCPGFLLEINSQMKFNDNQMKALLVHELAHVFILENNMEYDGLKNEFFTDFMAVYLGFGKIMSSGSMTREMISNSWSVSVMREHQLGYLTKKQLIQARKLIFNRPNIWELKDYLLIHPFLYVTGCLLCIAACFYLLHLLSYLR